MDRLLDKTTVNTPSRPLSSYAFSEYGHDARLYNGIVALEERIRTLEAALKPFADAERAWMDGGLPQEIRMDWMTALRSALAAVEE
jgi:hypothetical protein